MSVTPSVVDWSKAVAQWRACAGDRDAFYEAMDDGDWAEPPPDDWNDETMAFPDAMGRLEPILKKLPAATGRAITEVLAKIFDSTEVHDLDPGGDGDEVPMSLTPEHCASWAAILAAMDLKGIAGAVRKLPPDEGMFDEAEDLVAYLGQWRDLIAAASAGKRGLVIAIE